MHLDAGGHTGHAKPEHFKGEAWNEFVKFKIGRWEDLYSTWLVQVSQAFLTPMVEKTKTQAQNSSLKLKLWETFSKN